MEPDKGLLPNVSSVDSQKLEHGCGMIYAGFPSVFGSGLGSCPSLLASSLGCRACGFGLEALN